jgi:DNA-binding transcriptional LysR family regulator
MQLSGVGELFLRHAREILVRVGMAKNAVHLLARSSSETTRR